MLEVKDMRAMDWGTELVPNGDGKGRGERYQMQPTRHFPFPIDEDRSGNKERLGGGEGRMI